MRGRRNPTWVPCPDRCREGLLYLGDGSVAVCGTCDGLGRITTIARPGRLPGIVITALIVGIAWFVIGLLVGRASVAVTPTVWIGVPASAFAPLPVSLMPAAPLLTASPTARPTRKPTPRPRPTIAAVGRALRVDLTWYCRPGVSRCSRGYPGGHYAAASPDLLALGWRGRDVRVCWSGSCTTVRIVDCDCQATRSLDLYAEAFDDLADLGRGRLRGATAGLVR